MTVITENKICILINWSREIDMLENIINLLPASKFEVVINDINTFEKERGGNALQIKKIWKLRRSNLNIFLKFTKKKYKIVLSTGLAHSSKVTISSFLKFLYGKTFGYFFDLTGITKVFFKIFNRPFNAGGKYSRIGAYAWYPEKSIGEKSIRYPSGMDLKLRYYPDYDLEKNFDIFFTHSRLESDLINKKFKNKLCKIIGYPRYEKLGDFNNIKKELQKEFNLIENKKIIFWTPTHIYFPDETSKNFLPWINHISKLTSKFNVIIRPHPKLLNKDKQILSMLKDKNFFVDTNSDRKMGDIYKISDLIICDYGGTIFSAIFLEKPIVLLNMDKNTEFYRQQVSNKSLDILIRDEIINFDLNVNFTEFENFFLKDFEKQNIEKIKYLKKKYFGIKEDYLSQDEIKNFILNYLD